MKRAVIGFMVAALVLLVSPSALLPDTSSCYASPSTSTAGPATISPGDAGGVSPGGPNGTRGGGNNEGDADGLSGMGSGGSGKVIVQQELAASRYSDRVMILVGTWWRFMIWIR